MKSPLGDDATAVAMERFLVEEHRDDPELCASFIVQELEADLCTGHTPDSNALGFQYWGVHDELGRWRPGLVVG